jgi:hypothetical protein
MIQSSVLPSKKNILLREKKEAYLHRVIPVGGGGPHRSRSKLSSPSLKCQHLGVIIRIPSKATGVETLAQLCTCVGFNHGVQAPVPGEVQGWRGGG